LRVQIIHISKAVVKPFTLGINNMAQQTPITPIIMRPKQVAQYLSISVSQVRNMLKAGTLREIRLTNSIVGVLKTDVDAFIEGLANN
jgi:excisionase family DNA binding protein